MVSLSNHVYQRLHKLRHDFLGEQAQRLGRHLSFHARPLGAQYQFFHALLLVFVDLIDAFFGATDDEAAV